jgi:hypothetical protein
VTFLAAENNPILFLAAREMPSKIIETYFQRSRIKNSLFSAAEGAHKK